jgi:hypothetical protein
VAVAAAIAQSTATLIQIVNKSTPSVTATSSLNPSVFGTQVTFSASLTAALADNATGTVQWMDGATPIGSPVPVASAGASMPLATLTAGTHSITAVYSGDSDFTGATSAPISQVVNKATPGVGGFAPITVASSLNPSIYQNSCNLYRNGAGWKSPEPLHSWTRRRLWEHLPWLEQRDLLHSNPRCWHASHHRRLQR